MALKALGEVWTDGACRNCSCLATGAECSRRACAPPPHAPGLLLESHTPPGACCPLYNHTACVHNDTVIKVGEKLESPDDPCVSYECVSLDAGALERRVTRQECDTQCKPGYGYTAARGARCCGECAPVSCAVEGGTLPVGAEWTSSDRCTLYRCERHAHQVLVISEVQTCANVSEEESQHYQVESFPVPGECCPQYNKTACKYNDTVYHAGESWTEADACWTARCEGASDGVRVARAQLTCGDCAPGSARAAPAPRECCGACEPTHCVHGDQLRPINSTWQSEDNCTTVSCTLEDAQPVLTTHTEACPDVGACPPENLYTKGCCQHCKPVAEAQTSCLPEEVSPESSVGILEFYLEGVAEACTNQQPIRGMTRCSGGCASHTSYNKYTGGQDTKCECCQPTRMKAVSTEMVCPNGRKIPHQISVPEQCECRACGS